MLYGEMPELLYGEPKEAVRGFRFEVPHPKKEAILRLPTSAEMKEYAEAAAKVRGREDGPPSFRAELALFRKLRAAGDEFDEFEARTAIAKLIAVKVKACERTDEGFRVTLETPFCETEHSLGTPTAKQFYEALYSKKGGIGARLYDAVIEKADCYKDGLEGVPLHHREMAGGAVMDAVSKIYDSFDPNQ